MENSGLTQRQKTILHNRIINNSKFIAKLVGARKYNKFRKLMKEYMDKKKTENKQCYDDPYDIVSNYNKQEKFLGNKLYNFIFHFNQETSLWAAIPRDNYKDYFNGNRVNTGILYAKDMTTLVEFLNK